MNAKDRTKAQRLESIIAAHDASERRTLADLRCAGFHFTTIDAARRRLAAQRTLHGFTQRQIDIAIAALGKAHP